ncbi:UNVERIFIED_CONTAM: hypothetical protein FKN15_034377 [Acipenser sinensis]
MAGFYLCDICKKGLPTEDSHGRCAAYLGLEHTEEALVECSYSEFCAYFSTRTLEKRVSHSSVECSLSVPPGQGSPSSSAQKGAVSSHESSVPSESRTRRRPVSRSSSSSPSPSPPSAPFPKKRRKKSHRSHRSDSSEQLGKLWKAVSQQGNMLVELLHERTVTPAPSVPLQSQEVVHTEWQQEDLLSITESDEAVDREFPSEEGDSDSITPVAQCLKQYVELLIKEGLEATISCPDAACPQHGHLQDNEIECMVAADIMQRYKKLQFEREVLLDPCRTWCPSSSCQAVCQLKEMEPPALQLVQCTACNLEFCSACKANWHPEQVCQENVPATSFLPGETSLFYKSDEDDAPIKRCPKCQVYIERDEGCAQMMCKNCKHAFCWYCLGSLDVLSSFVDQSQNLIVILSH